MGLETFDGVDRIGFIALADDDLVVDEANTITVDLPAFIEPQEDLSEISVTDPAHEVIYEEFHYPDVPAPETLICSIIETFGDVFYFIALYTDFRIDRTTPTSRLSGSIRSRIAVMGNFRGCRIQPGSDHQGSRRTAIFPARMTAQTMITTLDCCYTSWAVDGWLHAMQK